MCEWKKKDLWKFTKRNSQILFDKIDAFYKFLFFLLLDKFKIVQNFSSVCDDVFISMQSLNFLKVHLF